MLKRMAITSLAAAAFLSTATVVTAPFTPAGTNANTGLDGDHVRSA